MSAETLRKAAEKLRSLVADAGVYHDPLNEEPWFVVPGADSIRTKWATFADAYPDEAPFIVAMHPGVGLALADLLQNLQGAQPEDIAAVERNALDVARLILGEEP